MCILSGPELLSTLPLQGRFYSSAFNAPCKLAFACSLWHSKLATAEEVLILVPDCSNSITFCGILCFPSTTHCLTHVTRACNALVTQTKQLCQPGNFCRLPLEFFTILMKSGRLMRLLLRFPVKDYCQMQQKLAVLLVGR